MNPFLQKVFFFFLLCFSFSALPSFVSLSAQKAEISSFIEALQRVGVERTPLKEEYILEVYESVGNELIEVIQIEMEETPHEWVRKECLNVAKLVGNRPNCPELWDIILSGLKDLDPQVREKSLICLTVLEKETPKTLKEWVAGILLEDIDSGTRAAAIRAIRAMKDPAFIAVLIKALEKEKDNGNRGSLVTTLKRLTKYKDVFQVDVAPWKQWFDKNKMKLVPQIERYLFNPIPQQNTFKINTDTSTPQKVIESFSKCLESSDFESIYTHLYTQKHSKESTPASYEETQNTIRYQGKLIASKRPYFKHFFDRLQQSNPPLIPKIIKEEQAVEYTLEQYTPEDRYSSLKIAKEFQVLPLWVYHDITSEDSPFKQQQKKSKSPCRIKKNLRRTQNPKPTLS
jgi:hypothetical protein